MPSVRRKYNFQSSWVLKVPGNFLLSFNFNKYSWIKPNWPSNQLGMRLIKNETMHGLSMYLRLQLTRLIKFCIIPRCEAVLIENQTETEGGFMSAAFQTQQHQIREAGVQSTLHLGDRCFIIEWQSPGYSSCPYSTMLQLTVHNFIPKHYNYHRLFTSLSHIHIIIHKN